MKEKFLKCDVTQIATKEHTRSSTMQHTPTCKWCLACPVLKRRSYKPL